ncbi:MAG: TlpA family protein disulfide reductase [Ignavibacteriae bacterium]|nr:TlpA family protein disulfide reductase [Ignavibacteriota bacterium]
MSLFRVFLVGTVLGLLLGCDAKEQSGDSAKVALSSAAGLQTQTVEVIDAQSVKQLVNERNGKVLFLNLWATWCAPCVEEFPDIVRLADEMPGEVEFVAISFDYPDEVDSKILPFLQEHKVAFRVLVAENDPDALINAIDPKWSGALPTTLIFDASGKRRSFLVGQRSYEQFKKELEKAQSAS